MYVHLERGGSKEIRRNYIEVHSYTAIGTEGAKRKSDVYYGCRVAFVCITSLCHIETSGKSYNMVI